MDTTAAVNRLESHISARKGVESCSGAQATSMLTVQYSPSSIGPRDIIQTIEVGLVSIPMKKKLSLFQSLGFTAELADREDQVKRLDHSEEVAK